MTSISALCDRVRAAHGLPAILDAAYVAFEEMLTVIQAHQDPDDAMFTVFVMAAPCAARGRDAVLFAPSLPPRPLRPATTPAVGEWQPRQALIVARELAGLCELVEASLIHGADSASGQPDQTACLDAAAAARELREYLSGSAP